MVTDKEFRELQEKVEDLLTLEKYKFVSDTYQRLVNDKNRFLKTYDKLDIKQRKQMDDLDKGIQASISYIGKNFGKINKIIDL